MSVLTFVGGQSIIEVLTPTDAQVFFMPCVAHNLTNVGDSSPSFRRRKACVVGVNNRDNLDGGLLSLRITE